MFKLMNLWLLILLGFMMVALFILSRPHEIPPAWYQIMPRVYDRLPTILRDGGGWGGRGIHRGEREIEMFPR
jgi:hypothetical protein